MASQGGHAGARYYNTLSLLTSDNQVRVTWTDCGTEEWLPKK